MPNTELLKKDFDEIARIYHPKWDHNVHYYKYLSKLIPENCETILDIGCGNGEFARLISNKSKKIICMDISPEMISIAKSQSKDYPNLEFEAGNVFHKNIPAGSFDCVVSIATFHHYLLEDVMRRSIEWLKEDGKLIVFDVYKPKTFYDFVYSLIAIIPDVFLNYIKNRHIRESKQIRQVWNNHSKNDRVITFNEVYKAAFRASATVKIKRHLFWRYSVICKKYK
jgi:ubiquinone/menaquinone biosynthesis C-methylase UbiE